MEIKDLNEMEIIKVHKKCFDMLIFAANYVMNFFERAKQNNEIEKYTFTFEIYKNGYNIMIYSYGLPFNGDGICDYVYSIYANVIDTNKVKIKLIFGGATNEFLLDTNDTFFESKIIEAIEGNIKQLDKFNKQLKAI
jgi:hypothetical protein